MFDNIFYTKLLDSFIQHYKRENRFIEFKSNYLDAKVLGEYISALSNGACLDHVDFGYLFFGVDNDTLAVKGTTFDPEHTNIRSGQSLELFLRLGISPKIRFEIGEFRYSDMVRVVFVKIPAAEGEPTMFNNEPFVRINESKTSLRHTRTGYVKSITQRQIGAK